MFSEVPTKPRFHFDPSSHPFSTSTTTTSTILCVLLASLPVVLLGSSLAVILSCALVFMSTYAQGLSCLPSICISPRSDCTLSLLYHCSQIAICRVGTPTIWVRLPPTISISSSLFPLSYVLPNIGPIACDRRCSVKDAGHHVIAARPTRSQILTQPRERLVSDFS